MPPGLYPPSQTLLAALPVVVLDLETTGLNVARDRVVQIGALSMTGAKLNQDPRLDALVNPGMAIPSASTRIHGISDGDVAQAPPLSEFIPGLRDLFAGNVVVGHHVGFDLAVLRYEAARLGLEWHDPPSLDLALLVGALEPALPDIGLETVASLLGVEIVRRHSAMGDCRATAEAFARLIPKLREADVRTLGEAQSFAGRRHDLLMRQEEAGWNAVPGQPPAPHPVPVAPRIDSYVFERSVGDLMSAPVAVVDPATTLRAVAEVMVERRIGALLVGVPDAPPAGIVTERDLLRVIAMRRPDLDQAPVVEAMSAPVETMAADDMLYRALGRMDRRGIRHLCIVDDEGRAVGMVSQRDLLHHRASSVEMLGDATDVATDGAALAAAYGNVPHVAEQLVAEGLGGLEVARVISGELRAMTARAAVLAEERLEREGRGRAPAPWCVLVLGSGGRGESLLGADQDNALIHTGTDADDAWFAEFGALIADMLDEAGIPRCKGGVMAATPEWRGSVAAWRSRIEGWLGRASPEDLISVDIFFDMVPVAGETAIARALQADAVHTAGRSQTFIGVLAQSAVSFAPRLGLFGTLRVEEGRVDMKRDGLLPVVNSARTVALRSGSLALSTPDRLDDAVSAGHLPEGDAKALIEVHADLLSFMLRQQLIDLETGVRPSSRVALKSLSRDERRRLKQHLSRVDGVVSELRALVSG